MQREILGQQIQEALHRPDPTTGWTGSPDLVAAYNRLEDRWELWEDQGDGTHRLIARGPCGERLSIPQMLRGLVERDTRLRGQDHDSLVDKMLKNIEKADAEREAKAVDAIMPVQEKLAWTVAKATGDLSPVVAF